MRQVLISILVCLLLAGCGQNAGSNGGDVPGNNEQTDQEPEDENGDLELVLRGQSLVDLGLTVDLEKLQLFPDPNFDDVVNSYFLWHTSEMTFQFEDDLSKLVKSSGHVTILAIEYSEGISFETVFALYLQGFEKDAAADSELFIEIDAQRYTLGELEPYKVFEDEQYFVLEITDLLPFEPFADRMEQYSRYDEMLDYLWLIDVYQYLKSHADLAIQYDN